MKQTGFLRAGEGPKYTKENKVAVLMESALQKVYGK
jgi:hypothetical protein